MNKSAHSSQDESGNPSTGQIRPEETEDMPIVPYRVVHAGIPFYSDPDCKNEVSDGTIVIVESLDPDDPYPEMDIMPTHVQYSPGQLVDWNLNNKRQWEDNWFRHPETKNIERAWTLHVEFTGRLISSRALQENQERLEEIEAKMAQKK